MIFHEKFFQCLAGTIPLFLTPQKIGLLKSKPSLCQCMETDKGVQRSMIHPSTDAANFDGLLVFHTITFGGKKATNLVCPLLSNKKTIQFLHTAVPTCAWAFVS